MTINMYIKKYTGQKLIFHDDEDDDDKHTNTICKVSHDENVLK